VVVRGEAIEVTDTAELARLRKLPLDPWAPGAKARQRALAVMLNHYLHYSATGLPVHTWPAVS
jgi:hypothetical protein